MTLFLSLVGFQPSAVAVALATWVKVYGAPEACLLLATAETTEIAKRLTRWAYERVKVRCRVESVSASLDARGNSPAADEVVARRLDGGHVNRVVFYADPGPKSVVVAVARRLPPPATIVHADDASLHVRDVEGDGERWATVPLQNLHLKALLSLYGLKPGRAGAAAELPRRIEQAVRESPEPERFRRSLTIDGVDGPVADLAWEARGRLYTLFVVEGTNGLERIREIERLPIALGGLRPRVAVWSRSPFTLHHAKAAGFLGLSAGTARANHTLRAWLCGVGPGPGHVVADEPVDSSSHVEPWHGKADADGPSLVVCLGADPAATLISLSTHRPRRAWVLYDARTPVVVYRARALRAELGRLPVAEVEFVPTDLYGRGIATWARGASLDGARVDITPGSKGQACALARLDAGELWRLDGPRGVATPVLGRQPSVRLGGPDLRVAGRIAGGPLEDSGVDATAIPKHRAQFLELLAGFLRCFLGTTREGVGRLREIGRQRQCPHGTMSIHKRDEQRLAVHIRHRDRSANGELSSLGGFWFEPLVAHAFVAAKADEVRMNMSWAWPREILDHLRQSGTIPPGERIHRREVDVAARFGHQVVCVSCKTGSAGRLEAQRREIEAVALGSFGRLAVPVLVHLDPDPRLVADSRRARGRALVVGLKEIAWPEQLREILDEAFRRRSTIGDE